ncbi:MAG: DegV family protein [Anaerolineales bacterium]
MPKIAVVTDTDSNLPAAVAERYNITCVPISIRFGDQVYRDAIDIDSSTLFARVDREGKLPQTAAPSPSEFQRAFSEALAAGAESLLCFCISTEVSGTCAAAQLAAQELEGHDITVVDTRQLSLAEGYMAIAAAEVAARGGSKEEALAAAWSVGERVHLYGALATLKYLALGGRISHLAAVTGSMLSIRPILTVRDGRLDLLEKARTRSRSWARVIELTAEQLGGRCPERMAVLHVAASDEAREFEAQLRASLPCPEEILMCELSPGISVHTGAGMVGVTFVTPA